MIYAVHFGLFGQVCSSLVMFSQVWSSLVKVGLKSIFLEFHLISTLLLEASLWRIAVLKEFFWEPSGVIRNDIYLMHLMYFVYFLIWWFFFQGKSSLSRTDIEGVFALYDRVTLAIVIYKLSSQFFYSMKHQKEHRMCSSLVFSEKTLHSFSLSMKWSSFSKITRWWH